jgi:hypothetical protein
MCTSRTMDYDIKLLYFRKRKLKVHSTSVSSGCLCPVVPQRRLDRICNVLSWGLHSKNPKYCRNHFTIFQFVYCNPIFFNSTFYRWKLTKNLYKTGFHWIKLCTLLTGSKSEVEMMAGVALMILQFSLQLNSNNSLRKILGNYCRVVI